MWTVHVSTELYLANRERLEAWVTAHGVDKSRVRLPATIHIDNSTVTFECLDLNDRGRSHLGDDGEVAMIDVTVPLVEPWPIGLVATSVRFDYGQSLNDTDGIQRP